MDLASAYLAIRRVLVALEAVGRERQATRGALQAALVPHLLERSDLLGSIHLLLAASTNNGGKRIELHIVRDKRETQMRDGGCGGCDG